MRYLTRRFPELCFELKHANKVAQERKVQATREKIQKLSTEMYGASLPDICKAAGARPGTIRKHFPDLSDGIARQYAQGLEEQRNCHRETLEREVKVAVESLRKEGLVPTLKRVVPLLGPHSSRDWKRIQQVIDAKLSRA